MESKIKDKKCSHHKNTIFSFYCFDDKEFLCSKCFKEHKKHNIEIIDDLKEKTLFFKSLNKMYLTLNDYYLKVKKVLEKVKSEIEVSLKTINEKIADLQKSAPPDESKSIFSLSFNEYEKISTISEILKKTHELSDDLGDLTKEIKSNHAYKNFRLISKSVKVLESSKEYPAHPLDIMFGRKNNAEFALFDGCKNHFLVLDLGEYCFLKKIKIGIDNYDCSLKNFKVQIKNDIGKWEDAGNFICAQFGFNPNIQEFSINKETQFVRMDLIDGWGTQSGNFIMIKFLGFEIGDIL